MRVEAFEVEFVKPLGPLQLDGRRRAEAGNTRSEPSWVLPSTAAASCFPTPASNTAARKAAGPVREVGRSTSRWSNLNSTAAWCAGRPQRDPASVACKRMAA